MAKIAIIGVSAALLSLLLRKEKPEYAIAVSLAAGVLLFAYILAQLTGVISFLNELFEKLPFETDSLRLLLKMLGIAYLAEFAADLCRDSGSSSMAGQIEVFAKLSIVALSLPFLSQLIELVEDFL